MAKIRVLLDACVLLPYQPSDLLLRLADAEIYEPLWSEDILIEVERNLTTTFIVPPEKASRRLNRMRAAFPNATVDGYDHLVAAMTNDQKDRHVAAAAVRSGDALIVTANLRDFPPNTLVQYDIEAIHPDDFLQDQRRRGVPQAVGHQPVDPDLLARMVQPIDTHPTARTPCAAREHQCIGVAGNSAWRRCHTRSGAGI